MAKDIEKNSEIKKFPTKFDGYYISEDGRIWTEWSIRGKRSILREMSQSPRGGASPTDRYLAVNISIKNELGKTIKQIPQYSHRLIAEALIENPNNYKEIDHIDSDKKNNHITNLRWVSRKENLKWSPKKFIVEDLHTGSSYTVDNIWDWVINNWDWISNRTRSSSSEKFTKSILSQYYKRDTQPNRGNSVGLKLFEYSEHLTYH